jgi:cytochrome c5
MNWRNLQPKFVFPILLVVVALTLAASSATRAERNENSKKDSTASATATAATNATASDDALRMEGERRFHANCGRCHAAPPKFSPRMAATIVRHMHVRATITDEEARLILHYMSE